MAKAKKSKAEDKREWFDAAGWPFWLVVFVILLIPSMIGMYAIRREDASWLGPIGMGVFAAALGAGIISWAVNAVIQRRARKRQEQARKQARKH
jgi:putative effector of murein hydrolase LrgA (UPF0299 family)